MGDVSIIARRLDNNYVQYGWSGNGGYFKMIAFKLLEWYQDPEDVEYLFELGQTKLIGKRGSENGGYGWFYTHELTGEPFWLGRTERSIFSKIAFIDYGYFYDLDHKWYYVVPGPFRIKMPLELVEQNLDENDFEFDFIRSVVDKVLRYILNEYREEDPEFRQYMDAAGYTAEDVLKNIIDGDSDDKNKRLSDFEFYDKYRKLYDYFDDWILIKSTEDNTAIAKIIVKKKTETHIETCNW